MRRLLAAGLWLAVASPAPAADPPKPNTLTPKEVADGWVLLFDGKTAFGWKVEGDAKVKDGALVLGAGKKAAAYPTTGFGSAFEYRLEVRGAGKVSSPSGFSEFQAGNPANWGSVEYSQAADFASGSATTAGSSNTEVGTPNPRPELKGAPLVIETDGKTELAVRSVKLRPLGAKPLFNGKDLAGWKVFQDPKRSATKFTVTDAGELSAKNGPGDLQTEGRYADFVLQLECKTNGKGLNSGVFFRCLPDQYQQGYEAQVQNAYVGGDRTKPVDFGTGAIYRRVPARKVVSDDNEWFTMTVAARGPHIATWVNGYQTVDWTDDRKPSDNARQGLKTGKGHLSIQGHDPTTDLLFRNIRIVDLGKDKN
jgi:hypothetical protein